jgi:hypothetical protein
VQAVEAGKVYSLNGIGGIFNNAPPKERNSFEGKISDETFVEMVNILNEGTLTVLVGEKKAFGLSNIPRRNELAKAAMMRGGGKVNKSCANDRLTVLSHFHKRKRNQLAWDKVVDRRIR